MNNRVFVFLLILGAFLCSEDTYADGELISSFGVQIVKPNNQIDLNKDYFNLKIEPNKTQEVKVKITPFTTKDTTVDIYLADATTSSGLDIIYLTKEQREEADVTESITDLVKVNQSSIVLKEKKPQEVSFTINPKQEIFDGVKLGTIFFEEKNDLKKNTVRYSIDMLLTENASKFDGGETLNFLSAKSDLRAEQNQLFLELENPTSLIISNLELDISVVNDETGARVIENMKKTGRMAPNSTTVLPIDIDKTELKEGTYNVLIDAKSSTEQWSLKQSFSIDKSTSKKNLDETITQKKEKEFNISNYSILIIELIFIIVLLFLIFIFQVKNKNKNKNKHKKRKGTKKNEKKKLD